jgi:hypothetical protein
MCPFCIAALGQVVAGVVSAGGLTALAVKLSRKKDNSNEIPNPHAIERSNQNESSS